MLDRMIRRTENRGVARAVHVATVVAEDAA